MTDTLDASLDRPEARQRNVIRDAANSSPARRAQTDNATRTRALITASWRATEDLKVGIACGRRSIAETRELLTALGEPYAAKRLRGGRRHGVID